MFESNMLIGFIGKWYINWGLRMGIFSLGNILVYIEVEVICFRKIY